MQLISVIVPVYNVETYLCRCINSILKQTYTSFELILIDDGSSDMSGSICDKYSNEDDRIYVIHQCNGGLSAARNAGIEWVMRNSESEWITFIDSDDWVVPQYLESLLNVAIKDKTNIVIGTYKETNGETLSETCNLESQIWKPHDYYLEYWGNAAVAWGKLYKKVLFKTVRYPIGKIHEDEYITYILLFGENALSVIQQPIYAYYQNANGIINSKWCPKRLDVLEALKNQTGYFAGLGYDDLAKRAFLCYVEKNMSGQKLVMSYMLINQRQRKEYVNKLKNNLRKMIIKYRRFGWISIYRWEDRYIFINAFNSLKAIYSIWKPTKKFLKRLVISVWVKNICGSIETNNQARCIKHEYKNNIRHCTAILLQTPLHGNLGDQAIAVAEHCLMNDMGIRYFDYPQSEGIEETLAEVTTEDKTILITGGGWIGQLWPNEEERFRNTLVAFRNNRVIVFPQTIYFDLKTEEGENFFKESKFAYEGHPNLTIFVREKISYNFMKEHMPNVRVILVPDMVMTMRPEAAKVKRKGALLCLRGDKERTLSDGYENRLIEMIESRYSSLTRTDTVVKENVGLDQREKMVNAKVSEFASAELVVTDRLHGMILAAITETPCIVLDSLSHKLRGCYEWIKDLGYIRFVDNIDDILSFMKELEKVAPKYNWDAMEAAMMPLYDELRCIKKKR